MDESYLTGEPYLISKTPGAQVLSGAINGEAVTAYLREQITAGVDAVMLFDTWGGLLPAAEYRRFSLAPMRAILAALPANVPTIVFTKNGGNALDAIVDSGASCVGLDWTVDLRSARERRDRVGAGADRDDRPRDERG